MKSYCTQNEGDCLTCSLVNYGRDCRNVLLMAEDEQAEEMADVHGKTMYKGICVDRRTERFAIAGNVPPEHRGILNQETLALIAACYPGRGAA
jgi:hypothetical protein